MSTKSYHFIAVFILLLTAATGCAGLPGRGGISSVPPNIEIKMAEANQALDAVNEQASAFYAQLNTVISEIVEFRSRPYWNEFEQVLLEYPSLKDPDNEPEITPAMKSRLSVWSRKWNEPWKQILDDYLRLVDKCTILEAKRLAAREKLLAAQARYIALVIMESSSGHEKEGKEIYSVVEALDKTGAELDSYKPDDLGLYEEK